jgi:type II secretory pathway pseudopilin PulG
MSLIELMVAMVILAVVVAAAFSVAFSIMNSYREHRRASTVERSARGAISVLSQAVRGASPGLPAGQVIDLVGCEAGWQAVRVDNAEDGPDALELVHASGAVVTTLSAPFTQSSAQIAVEDGSLFQAGDQVLVTDLVQRGHLLAIDAVTPSGGGALLTVRAGAPETLCPPGPAPFSYPARSTVLRVQRARYEVHSEPDPGAIPFLRMDPDGPAGQEGTPVAEGIEDLQIAIAVDLDQNGAIAPEDATAGNADEWIYNHPDDADPPELALRPYRAIRVTVIARSHDESTTSATSQRPPVEDREGAAAPDELRRRVLSTTVEIRNLEGSP